jgi:hypothetical protein
MLKRIESKLNKKQFLKAAKSGTFFIVVLYFLLVTFPVSMAAGNTYYISPQGSDSYNGLSAEEPFKTIQKALDRVQPGDTVVLAPGEYYQDIITQRHGKPSLPIIITGPSEAVIKGGGKDRVIQINHNYYTLNGFTIDGLYGNSSKKSGYRDILIFVQSKTPRQYLEGLKILNMTVKNAGGECIRLRYFITEAEIAYNTIGNCGVYDFVFHSGGKNGEGIYVGTSNKQWKDGKNPTSDPDETKNNYIHHNYIDTQGNECVDIKEGSTGNIIEYNTCRGQKDPNSGGFDSRGDGNVFRYNDVRESIGAGVRLGGTFVNGIQYGKNNDVYENTIANNKNGGVKFQVAPQGKVCGNTMFGNTNGNSVGNFASRFQPDTPCKGSDTSTNASTTISNISASTTPVSATTTGSSNTPDLEFLQGAESLANSNNLVSTSNNFSNGYEPSKLWDRCYEGALYNSNTCTTGGRDIASFWLEFDFKKPYQISYARLYGDADGDWVSKSWTLKYKQTVSDSWATAFSNKNALFNDWSAENLNITARYIRVEVFGNKSFNPGKTQARELEIYGTESVAVSSVPLGGSGSGRVNNNYNNQQVSGGGGVAVPVSSDGGGGGVSAETPNKNKNLKNKGSSFSSSPTATSSYNSNLESQPSDNKSRNIFTFTRTLYFGMKSFEVKKLQELLNTDPDTRLANSGPGSPGSETDYFGPLTKKAVIKFQEKYAGEILAPWGLAEGTGIVGRTTRAKLNQLLEN